MFLRSLVLSVALLVGMGVAQAQPDTLSFNLVSYSMCNPESCMQYDYSPFTGISVPVAVNISINGVCQTGNGVGAGAEAFYDGTCPYDAYVSAQAYASWSIVEVPTPFGTFAQAIGFVLANASAGGEFGTIVFSLAQDTCNGIYYSSMPQYSGCFPYEGF